MKELDTKDPAKVPAGTPQPSGGSGAHPMFPDDYPRCPNAPFEPTNEPL